MTLLCFTYVLEQNSPLFTYALKQFQPNFTYVLKQIIIIIKRLMLDIHTLTQNREIYQENEGKKRKKYARFLLRKTQMPSLCCGGFAIRNSRISAFAMRIKNPYIHIVWISNPDNIALSQNSTHIKSS